MDGGIQCELCGNSSVIGYCKECFDSQSSIPSTALLAGYVAEATRLVEVLRAYDGSGIPHSDAREAFSLLRKMMRGEPSNPSPDRKEPHRSHAETRETSRGLECRGTTHERDMPDAMLPQLRALGTDPRR